MVVIRRRLFFWIIRAYIKKSVKTIVFSFFAGLLIFFLLLFASQYFMKIIPAYKKATIGLVGAYTQDNLPPAIIDKLSEGLTRIEQDGTVKPDIASSWQIADSGKTYIFHLKNNYYFSDGKNLTSDSLSYNFSDVNISRPDRYTIVFTLKYAYAPFLLTVSRPVFEKGFIGVGKYRIADVTLNGDFVQSITLASRANRFDIIRYQFYPTVDSLKMAYLLGEISQAQGLTDLRYKNTILNNFSNTKVTKLTNASRLVTLFYNNADSTLSDKRLRIALSYALPDSFSAGEAAYLPYSPQSLYYNKDLTPRTQDYTHAKLFLSAVNTGSAGAQLTIITLSKYESVAREIARSWKNVGIKTKIQETDTVPTSFQIFLGDFNLSLDPDQYTLWHTDQANNITRYKNLRIDKLLEDGRETVNITKRKQIYDDFQKYLTDDAPASFLYFPYEYTVVRK